MPFPRGPRAPGKSLIDPTANRRRTDPIPFNNNTNNQISITNRPTLVDIDYRLNSGANFGTKLSTFIGSTKTVSFFHSKVTKVTRGLTNIVRFPYGKFRKPVFGDGFVDIWALKATKRYEYFNEKLSSCSIRD